MTPALHAGEHVFKSRRDHPFLRLFCKSGLKMRLFPVRSLMSPDLMWEYSQFKALSTKEDRFKLISLIFLCVSGDSVIHARILFAFILELFFDFMRFPFSFSSIYTCIYSYILFCVRGTYGFSHEVRTKTELKIELWFTLKTAHDFPVGEIPVIRFRWVRSLMDDKLTSVNRVYPIRSNEPV